VAKVHFALTVFCIVAPIFISNSSYLVRRHTIEAYFQALEHRAWRQAWFDFVCNFGFCITASFLLFSKIFEGLGDKFTFSYKFPFGAFASAGFMLNSQTG